MPEPTSPWSSRCIGVGRAISPRISWLTCCWACRQLEGQTGIEVAEQTALARAAARRRDGRGLDAALPEQALQDEGLLVAQVAAGRVDVGVVARCVQGTKGAAPVEQPAAAAQGLRDGVDDAVELAEDEPHAAGDRPRVHAGHVAVDRDEAGVVGIAELAEGGGFLEGGVARVGELGLPAELRDRPGEEQLAPGHELVLVATGVEEGHPHARAPVGDRRLEHPTAPLGHRAGARRLDPRDGDEEVADPGLPRSTSAVR